MDVYASCCNFQPSLYRRTIGNNPPFSHKIECTFHVRIASDTALIVPEDLKLYTGRALISFDTETEKNKILLRGNVKGEDTDLIQLYTNLDTLVELTKRLPIAMDIQKE